MTRDLEAENTGLREALILASHRTPPYSKETQAKIDAALSPPSASEQSAMVAGSPDAWRG